MQTQILKALSIENLMNYDYKHPTEIDVVISVGGFYGFFAIGVNKILKKLEREHKIIIKRYSGASVGAICSVLMACNVPSDIAIKIYNYLQYQDDYFDKLKNILLEILPPNAYEICSDKVFIYATHVTLFGFKKKIFSKFKNNHELIDACMASSNMPYFVSKNLFYKIKNEYYLDGCFSNLLPIFNDNINSQLLIKLYKIKYYNKYAFMPYDPSIEGLVVKGAIEMNKFLKNDENVHIKTIEWFNEKKYKKKKKLRKILLISSSFGLILIYFLKKKFNKIK